MASAAWEQRNERARALGYDSYYDYRAHDYGRSESKLSGERLRAARGHAGFEDLRAWAREGGETVSRIVERDSKGRRKVVEIQYVDDRGFRAFRLRGHKVSDRSLRALRAELEALDVDVDAYEGVWGPP